MAIAAVAHTKLTGAGTTASGAISATAGNALIVAGNGYNGTAWSVARAGDTYTTDTSGTTAGTTDKQVVGIASAPNVAGGSVTLTATATSAIGTIAYCMEWSGLATSSMRDATSPAVKTGNSTTSSANSLTNATADALFIVMMGSESGANPVTVTAGAGYTDTIGTAMKETNGATSPAGGAEYKIVSSVAAQTGGHTITSSQWAEVIAVYKIAGGGPPPVTYPQLEHASMRGASRGVLLGAR